MNSLHEVKDYDLSFQLSTIYLESAFRILRYWDLYVAVDTPFTRMTPKLGDKKKCPKAANFRRISGPVVLYGPLVPPLATLGAPGTSRCPHQLAVYVLFSLGTFRC